MQVRIEKAKIVSVRTARQLRAHKKHLAKLKSWIGTAEREIAEMEIALPISEKVLKDEACSDANVKVLDTAMTSLCKSHPMGGATHIYERRLMQEFRKIDRVHNHIQLVSEYKVIHSK